MTDTYSITFAVKRDGQKSKVLSLTYNGEVHELNAVANAAFYKLRDKNPNAKIHRGPTMVSKDVSDDS